MVNIWAQVSSRFGFLFGAAQKMFFFWFHNPSQLGKICKFKWFLRFGIVSIFWICIVLFTFAIVYLLPDICFIEFFGYIHGILVDYFSVGDDSRWCIVARVIGWGILGNVRKTLKTRCGIHLKNDLLEWNFSLKTICKQMSIIMSEEWGWMMRWVLLYVTFAGGSK